MVHVSGMGPLLSYEGLFLFNYAFLDSHYFRLYLLKNEGPNGSRQRDGSAVEL